MKRSLLLRRSGSRSSSGADVFSAHRVDTEVLAAGVVPRYAPSRAHSSTLAGSDRCIYCVTGAWQLGAAGRTSGNPTGSAPGASPGASALPSSGLSGGGGSVDQGDRAQRVRACSRGAKGRAQDRSAASGGQRRLGQRGDTQVVFRWKPGPRRQRRHHAERLAPQGRLLRRRRRLEAVRVAVAGHGPWQRDLRLPDRVRRLHPMPPRHDRIRRVLLRRSVVLAAPRIRLRLLRRLPHVRTLLRHRHLHHPYEASCPSRAPYTSAPSSTWARRVGPGSCVSHDPPARL